MPEIIEEKNKDLTPAENKQIEEIQRKSEKIEKLSSEVDPGKPVNIIGDLDDKTKDMDRKELREYLAVLSEKLDLLCADLEDRKRKEAEALKQSTTTPERKSWLNARVF